jgi:opacity protein-like surface antigen
MNKILKLSAIALLASSTSLMAQSKGFEGASIALSGSIVGASVDGTVNDSNGSSSTGSIGKVTMVPSIDAAYTLSAGSNAFVAIGASYVAGNAEFSAGNTGTGGTNAAKSFTGEIKDHYSIYIQPGYAVNNSSAIYAKLSYNHADFNLSGATVTKQPGDLEGWGYGVGLKTFLTPNAYVQVEASYTEYDSLRATATNTNSEGATSTQTVTGKPKIAAGTISVGYKF